MIAPLPLLLSISRLTRTPFEATVNIHYYLTLLHDVAAFLTPHLPRYNVAPYIKLRVTIFASHLDSCINRVFSGVCCNPVIIITSAFSQRASDSTKLPPFLFLLLRALSRGNSSPSPPLSPSQPASSSSPSSSSRTPEMLILLSERNNHLVFLRGAGKRVKYCVHLSRRKDILSDEASRKKISNFVILLKMHFKGWMDEWTNRCLRRVSMWTIS